MFHLQKNMKMRIVACLLIFSMILTAISPGFVARADEATISGNDTTTWNFRGSEEGAFKDSIEGTTGEFDGIQIDATKGKLTSRTSDTQMNAGTKLAVPVSGSAIVAVKTHPEYYGYTINGEAATSGDFEYTYTGEEGYVTIEATKQLYLHEISRTPVEAEIPVVPELPTDTSKIDVWDFGAETLDESKYNNKLTKDIINGEIFPGVEPGSTGKNLASFSLNDGEFLFNDGGFPATHRLRTTNLELTRTDEKSLTADGVTYNGYIYSNKGSTKDVYLGVYLYKNDIITLVVASNGNNSTINVESPSGKVATQVHTNGSSTATVMTFYASEAGTYKIYSSDEKLVVARVYREHTNSVEVTGNVSAPEGLSDYAIKFTNKQTGEVISADVVDGMYNTTLNETYDYEVALENANGYVISSDSLLSIALGAGDQAFDITVEAVSLSTLTGKVTGLSEEALSKLKLSFVSENIYVPEITLSADGSYFLQLETGVEYSILVEGVNDYNLTGNGKISATENKEYDFAFVEKAKYPVNVSLVGIDEAAKNSGKITFTNINEEGYSYTYNLSDVNIELRDGQYSVNVAGTGEYPVAMTLSPDVKVAGAKADATVNFTKLTSWNFGALNKEFGGQGIESINNKKFYYGLQLSDTAVAENKTYLLMSAGGEIVVPVKAGDIVTINYCYSASFKINDGSILTVDEKSGSTGQIDSVSYTATESGYITISCFAGEKASQTYVTGITVTTPVEYKDVLTVGATGFDYKTINEALDAVKEMNRPNNERVIIEIQPGNYEEMLVVDVPNVTLKNASSKPSIDLTNKGVDIAAEAVRITSYYGHGYSYYSMGKDNKYDANALAVNKANDYLSQHNPGSGTTNGSYWNATVVVMADGFNAEGIIFENSFNQYISEKEANDVVVLETGNKGVRSTTVGDTAVQDKTFVERAAALAIANNVQKASFDNCRFVGRQDTLYGGENVTASFYKSAIMGGTDYIFGGMTAVFYKCDLVHNTSENNNDVTYITAAQQKSGRGYLMYNCTVTSTTPGVDTASTKTSKPGYLGRPWQANTSEVVFYKTIIETTNFADKLQSMIIPEGWTSTLGGQSKLMYEYGTMESLEGTDNSAQRASWSTILKEAKLSDGTDISTAEKAVSAFLKDWKPFELDATDDEAEIVVPGEPEVEPTVYTWDVTTLDSTNVADKAPLPEGIYENFFKSVGKVTQRTSSTTGKITSIEVDKTSTGAIQFTVTGTADVVVEMSSTGGTNTSAVGITDQAGNLVAEKNNIITVTGTSKTTLTYSGLTAGTYSIVSPASADYSNRGARIYSVAVTEVAGVRPPRQDWELVAAPVISGTEVKDGDVVVSFNMEIGYNGADSVTVTMKKGNETITSVTYAKDGSKGSVTFTPPASGDYTFSIYATRENNEKAGADYNLTGFVLPLLVPYIESATSIGGGAVKVTWKAVKEAESYIVAYKEKGATSFEKEITVKTNQVVLEGLAVGTTYIISVKAVRGSEETKTAEVEALVTQEEQREWKFSAFGSGVNTTDNYFTGNANLGSVTVASVNGKGKLVPASTDGLAFYYTTINPEKENFILNAKVTVDNWTLSNGQEGFGLMVADAVGEHGNSSTFWNNSYMTSVTKVEYFWDSENNKVSDAGDKISMKLGVGAQQKIGAIGENTNVADFKSSMYTLETSCASSGTGTYNIIGNYTNEKLDDANLVTTLDLTIQRDNTGYKLSYTDEQGNTTTKLFYDIDRNALTQVDKDNIYVGFFASRNAKITVTDIKLTVSNPETDPPAEEIETTYVTPSYKVISTQDTGNVNYELVYLGNADGILTIKDSKGNTIANEEAVTANILVKKNVILAKGTNTYTITFTPDKDYKPGEHQELSNYDPVTFTHTVTLKNYDRNALYVSPSGKASGDGSKSNPLDIYTAVKYVTPGQKIVLAGGTYSLNSSLTVARGVDGTKDAMIYMVADPEATTRPVFDFNKKVTGIVFAGDYWYMQGFDVTNSADGQKGLQLSGSYCTLDNVNTYRNGNTGIQLSRYLTTDTFEDWPSNNLILNCTSYANADRGYEDADGFAAKLTIGEGNVFDGCIAYNNADDGWDLFAKIESGPIGKVTIKNSVAYANGYLPDGTNAGNGNGFKMGGSSITGYHELINSVAFDNKAKGIDSNSCPDIQVYNSTTFNNESYNVAFYTNDVKNTDFFADGIISYKTQFTSVNDNFKLLGNQDINKVKGTTNYYWMDGKSTNTDNKAAADDWFVNLDTTTKVTRNADGTINMNGLLELTDKAPADAGARMTGTPSKVIVIDDETVTPEPTSTPQPTSAPQPTSTPSPTVAPVNPDETVNVTVSVDGNGNVNWNDVNKVIKEKLDALNNNENGTNTKPLSVTIDMKSATVLGKELLETVKGQNALVSIVLKNGITWTINGKELNEQEYHNVDLAVDINTTSVPNKAISQLVNKNDARTSQISLAHDGDFGFNAVLTIDLTKLDSEFAAKDIENLIAGVYYYDAKTGELVLQSASRIDKNGTANFNFTHGSAYVVTVSDKLVVDDTTLNAVTVNGVGTNKLAKRWKYVGGTTGNKERLEIVLPKGLQDAVDKGLIDFKASFTTSNNKVAIVAQNGIATAKTPGVAVIKATIKIGDKTFVYNTKITVKKAFIKFIKSPNTVKVGQKVTYQVAVYGFNAKDITWLTSKRNIAIVYKNQGKLTAVIYGKTVGKENVLVRVLDNNGNYVYGKAPITVKAK